MVHKLKPWNYMLTALHEKLELPRYISDPQIKTLELHVYMLTALHEKLELPRYIRDSQISIYIV